MKIVLVAAIGRNNVIGRNGQLPWRLKSDLMHFRALTIGKPLWLVTHFNHAVELTDASRAAIATLLEGGVPVANQSVLLHGVNDSEVVLVRRRRCGGGRS